MRRPTFTEFKNKALKNPKVKQEYEKLAPVYDLRKKLISLRHSEGYTQEQVAEKLNTSKSNISRLESVHSTISPKLSTIQDYVEAIGYQLKIDIVRKSDK